MENKLKLYMVMIGCTPAGRLTEQHDIFFGIGTSMKELIPDMKSFWPEAKGKIHVDAWREVTVVDNFSVTVIPKNDIQDDNPGHLFFINLGGYKENEFEEYHYKSLTIAKKIGLASKNAKKSTFYKHFGFKGAESHIDEKYGLDVDDIYKVIDVLPEKLKNLYSLKITKSEIPLEHNTLNIGYFKLSKLT